MMKKPSPMKSYEMGEGFLSEKPLLFLFVLLKLKIFSKFFEFCERMPSFFELLLYIDDIFSGR